MELLRSADTICYSLVVSASTTKFLQVVLILQKLNLFYIIYIDIKLGFAPFCLVTF